MAHNTVEHESTLSDALLRQLMAVGQVDILVGLPTLNNAATIIEVVRAVYVCFTRDFPRLRTVMINSDGGSTDGTVDLIRSASFSQTDMVQTSHALRTLHRVVAPYHGLPGKQTALRTIFAASELTQARVLVVLDPNGPATVPERVTELIGPVARREVAFLAPRYRRHPRDGVLITQLVRPIVRGLYGVALDEPLGAEFACAGHFASHCLEQDIWRRETARFAIDLWLRTEAVAHGHAIGQIWRPTATGASVRATLREVVRQIVISLVECLSAHESFWTTSDAVRELRTWGDDPVAVPDPPAWDYQTLGQQAHENLVQIAPLLEEVLNSMMVAHLIEDAGCPLRLNDELWVRAVYAFVRAIHRRRTSIEQLTDMFVPLYMWRAAGFMAQTALEPAAVVQGRLDSLCETFQRLKPALVAGWSAQE